MNRVLSGAGLLMALAVSPLRADDDDYRRAWEWRQSGRVVPLEEILERVDPERRVRILEVELEAENGRILYEIHYADPDGRIREWLIDAHSGELLADEED